MEIDSIDALKDNLLKKMNIGAYNPQLLVHDIVIIKH